VPGLGVVEVVLVGVALLAVLALCAVLVTVLRRTAPPAAGPRDDRTRIDVEQLRQRAETDAADVRQRAETDSSDLRQRAESDAADVRRRAEAEAAEIRHRAEVASRHALDIRDEAEAESRALKEDFKEQRLDLERREHRLAEREERLVTEGRHLDERVEHLSRLEVDLAARSTVIAEAERERLLLLERTAGLSAEQAKAELVGAMEHQAKRDAAVLVRDLEAAARTEGEQRARHIVVDAIQRVATEQTSESVVSVVHLPADDMKGRIIGREGRNIRTFESVTGVNVIIDDTPEAVLLSCFEPVRREIARITLEALVLDGRIHPHRIEEMYERSAAEVEALCVRAGEDALVEVAVTDVHPDLVRLLGRLRYRTSYGQNVLKHLIETAHIAGIMAAELGVEPTLVRRGAFLHDIGKALTSEVEGSHAMIGADLARKYGESPEVVHAIEAHHNEVAPQTIEAVLTQAADSCSGGRPGARRESLEAYVKRLARIEEIGRDHDGVDKVFAMQAGREIRVMVRPEQVDDIEAQVLARDIAKQIEEELTYPGQIRITVIRESRATETAR
jgi:ribonuclease Y